MANHIVINASGATASVDGVAVAADAITTATATSALGSIESAAAGLLFSSTNALTAAQKARAARILLDDAVSTVDLSSASARESMRLKRGLQEMQDILATLVAQ